MDSFGFEYIYSDIEIDFHSKNVFER